VPKQTVAIVPGAAVWRNRTPSNALRYRLEGADVLFGVEPRFYGEPVPISGSASATH
jgi:vancomycin permeability regulator SanA